jgi:hypothetical protein
MSITLNTVVARVADVRERGDPQVGLIATITYHLPWKDRIKFYEGLAGELTTITVTGGGSLTRRTPHRYPDSPATAGTGFLSPMYAQPDIAVRPLGKVWERADGWAEFGRDPDTGEPNGLAEVEVNYQRLIFDPASTDPYLSESKRGAGQFLTLPGTPFRFVSDAKPIQQDVGKFIPQIEVQRVYDQAAALAITEDTIFALAGTVNAATFRGRPAGHWMMAMVEDHRAQRIVGTPDVGLALSLVWLPHSWNHIFRRDTGLWEAVTPPIYDEADWSILDSLPA